MSRSRKNYAVWVYNDNPWHIADNRRYRHKCKKITQQLVNGSTDWDAFIMLKMREVSNPYNWPSDGGALARFTPHRCTAECELNKFETRWCKYDRQREAKAKRK